MRVVMSSGHGKYIRGASGKPCGEWGVDEVDEARRTVERVAGELERSGVSVTTLHDDVSTTQDANLRYITNAHNNAGPHDLDVSVHLNAYQCTTSKKMGCEVWYYSQQKLAADISAQMADALSLPNRGAKKSTSLYFLKHCKAPAVLLELMFCDAKPDCDSLRVNFEEMCAGIAVAISGREPTEPIPPEPPTDQVLFQAKGRCSWFGGPTDTGVSPSEGLAFLYDVMDNPLIFLPYQPQGTTGLARRLNSEATHFVACRWDYSVTPKGMLAAGIALVRANGMELQAYPGDWGPHENTGRICDLSLCLMKDLRLSTDQECEVIFPAPGTAVGI